MANEVTIRVVGRDQSGHAFASARSSASRFSGVLRGLVGAAAGLFVFDRVASLVGGFVSEAEEAQRTSARTAQTIRSMGTDAGLSAAAQDRLATSLSRVAAVDDEVIAGGMNVLRTFRNIRNEVGEGNDVFNQASEVALDMSSALGQDLQSSIIQVGKALNDPIQGLTALRRVGVSFTEQQKEQIATLVEQGDLFGAQKLILQELQAEFAGAAEANATATDRISVAWGNIQEQLGGLILPLFEGFADWLSTTGVAAVESFVAVVRDEVIPQLQAWGDTFASIFEEKVQPIIEEGVANFGEFASGFSEAWGRAFADFEEDIAGIRDAANDFFSSFEEGSSRSNSNTRDEYRRTGEQVAGIIRGAVRGLSLWIQWQLRVATAAGRLGQAIMNALGAAARFVSRVWSSVFGWFSGRIEALRRNVESLLALAGRVASAVSGGGGGGLRPSDFLGGAVAVGSRVLRRQHGGPAGGWTLLGERAAELVKLPHGSMVRSGEDTARMAAQGGGQTITVLIDISGGDDRLMDWLRDRIRVVAGRGDGSVQRALGVVR